MNTTHQELYLVNFDCVQMPYQDWKRMRLQLFRLDPPRPTDTCARECFVWLLTLCSLYRCSAHHRGFSSAECRTSRSCSYTELMCLQLSTLDLAGLGPGYGWEGQEQALCGALHCTPNLRDLSLDSWGVGPPRLACLARTASQLTSLDVSSNSVLTGCMCMLPLHIFGAMFMAVCHKSMTDCAIPFWNL